MTTTETERFTRGRRAFAEVMTFPAPDDAAPTNVTLDGLGNVSSSSNISYQFRINNIGELEIIKYNSVLGSNNYQKVAKFGRSLF